MGTNEDWGYKTQPQEGACRSYKRKGCAWPRGKVLGGCSSINGMFAIRGNKLDYDEWNAHGNYGWSYNEVLPYFKKLENMTDDINMVDAHYHGTDGYLNIQSSENIHDIENIIIQANKEIGIKHIIEPNGPEQMGIFRSFSNIKNGIRQSTARAYLSPVKDRKNLHVIKKALATKILIKPGNKVSGVLIKKDDKYIKVNVKKDLVVSAGTVNTPQLLMLSGIGPRKHLKELNIDLKQDLPVGENLEDHVFIPLYYTLPGDKNMNNLFNITTTFYNYLLHQKGLYSDTSPHKVIDFINTTDPNSSSPNIQHHYLVFGSSQYNLIDVYMKHGTSDEFQKKFREINENNIVLIIYTVLLKPKSKGKILLNSSNPDDLPLIYANYFDKEDDMLTIINGIKHILKLAETKTFKEIGFKLTWLDIEACQHLDKSSDEFLKCMVKEMSFSLYHPTGTAKMGPVTDNTAVVDPELKVRGIQNLRVADASIMPSIVRGNTNIPIIMIGEKASDIIKKEWLQQHTEL